MRQKAKVKPPKPLKDPDDCVVIAKYIITKYIQAHLILWPRDMKIGKSLATQFPSLEFWKAMPKDYELSTMAQLITPRGLSFIRTRWNIFCLDMPVKTEYFLGKEKVGEPYVPSSSTKKPTSIIDFCK